jgi:hypothetical protein
MKSLREYIDIIDEAQTAEGLRSGLAGAALAATTAMTPAAATETPTYQQQIVQAIQAGDVPRGNKYQASARAGWITQVTVDGKTYDITNRIPPQGQRMMAAADQIRQAMQEEVDESATDDAIRKIDYLFRT